MSSPVLRTKLFIPSLKPNLVVRARLLARLDEGLRQGQHFFLVSAPAGFGKSTLVSQWIHSATLRAVWLTLDEADNDPIRLWKHLVAALTEINSAWGSTLQEFLSAPQPPSFKTLTASLINELASLETSLAIIFDDYHVIENEEIHDGIAYLINHLPVQIHICILTRADPPIALSRLRGRGELCEVRASDMRFNSAESADFFNAKMHLDLSARDLEALEERTEGWITGLQMAALSLQGLQDKHNFITAFSGDDRYIADYLLEEVLDRQPQEIQDFLLKTSILDRMCAPLCNELTGRSDSQILLSALDRANLFVVPLDNRRDWFRYHHLFASLLRQNLTLQTGQEAVAALQARVIAWYENNGYPIDAIEMALAGQFYERAAETIETVVIKLMGGSELTTILKWASRIPRPIMERFPRLCLFSAWAANATGRNKQCYEFLEMGEKAVGYNVRALLDDPQRFALLNPIERNQILEIAAIYIRLAVDNMDIPTVFHQSELILPYLTRENDNYPYISNPPSALFSPIRFMQGVLLQILGRLDEAVKAFEDCVQSALDPETPNVHILALGYGHLGEIFILQGRLDAAATNFQSALQAARNSLDSPSVFHSLSMAGLGLVEYELGNFTLARELFTDSIRMGRMWNHWDSLIPATVNLARLEFFTGKPEKALNTLDTLYTTLLEDLPGAIPIPQGMIARFQAISGSRAAAIAWVKLIEAAPIGHTYLLEQGVWLRSAVLLEIDQYTEALALLDPAIAEAEANKKRGKLVGLLTCRAAALHGLGRNSDAVSALRSALDLASAQGAYQSIAEFSTRLRDLLLAELRSQTERTDVPRTVLVRRLLASAESSHTSQTASAGQEWVEPLSSREIEVLTYMAAGLSNNQIATKLVVAPNTIKKHIGNIFSKLNVTNRLQAVEKARAIGVIPK